MAKKEELKAALQELIKKVDAGEELTADDVRKLIVVGALRRVGVPINAADYCTTSC
jgi:hypothetical protein